MTARAASGGSGELHVASVAGRSSVVCSWARSPIRLLTPRWGGESVWAYTSSFGGGMVAGDRTRLDVRVDAGATLFLGTQSSTKIYRNPARLACSHELNADIGPGALLALAPDAVQCFANSSYAQRQNFVLAPDGNLAMVDWLSSGRVARLERWAFHRYFSRNEVRRGGKTVFLDPLLLDNSGGAAAGRFQGGRFDCLASVLLLGPKLEFHAKALLAAIASEPVVPRASLIVSASPCADGLVMRLAGASVEEVGRAIQRHLSFLSGLLQDDPWARKW